MEIAYWKMCNDLSKADLLTMRFKSLTYAGAKHHGTLRFNQAHDDAGSLGVARRCHYEEDAIGQLTRKGYWWMLQRCATQVRGRRTGPSRGRGYLITYVLGAQKVFCQLQPGC